MTTWKIYGKKDLKLSEPILIEGLPGIGNVGKIVVDTVVEELKAKKVLDFFSYSLPNSVFVNEDSLIELPKIELYHKKLDGKDFLFLTGDVQPMEEQSSYEFTDKVLELVNGYGCKEIITLGGIGINEAPEKPRVYCTGNSKQLVNTFKKFQVDTKLYGIVGPIIGVSGLLLGLSKNKKIDAAAILAETLGHQMYIGIRGAREIINVLNKKYSLKISTKNITKEIKKLDEEMNSETSKKHKTLNQLKQYKETNYIG
ncbi:hypothetical protein CMO90_00340 [Candidatus Woesearchaeota archaeon]|jgi:hypothetical protein|nr:hypothetical protein [Candidatus Woesearchaeota archaeon]